MSIEMKMRPMSAAERMYCYTQSTQIMGQTGCIGHLRADMDTNGDGFFSTWDDHRGYLKTDQFKAEFDQIINRLRFGPGDENGIRHEDENCILKDRSTLARYCWSHPLARIKAEEDNYGIRVDTDAYTYMMRLNPNKGEYNVYCYCYRRDWLEDHMKNAEKGIRFIDSDYNTLFKIKDGGTIRITFQDGTSEEKICRYIDEYHVEIGFGFGSCNLFHICEFAEKMEHNGNNVAPISGLMEAKR